jgi:hypothetical protein
MFDVAVVELAADDEPPDPARPEAVAMSIGPERVGHLRRRMARRLLHRLVAPEQIRLPLLGTRGPSIAYIDLEPAAPSLALIATSPKSLRCYQRHEQEAFCSFTWAGTTQALRLLDSRASALVHKSAPEPVEPDALAAAIGGKPGYLLVGLVAIRGGHVPKAVLSIIPKRPKPPPDDRGGTGKDVRTPPSGRRAARKRHRIGGVTPSDDQPGGTTRPDPLAEG